MEKRALLGLTALLLCTVSMPGLTGCGNGQPGQSSAVKNGGANGHDAALTAADLMAEWNGFPAKLQGDKYCTFYEVFVYSFYDGDGDGVGDLKGLTEKLDYIGPAQAGEEGLGCDGLWLMPIMPSPSYHKYDITDYMAIDPQYGDMADFDRMMEECGKRGIRVILDLVMNHTSTQHEWFVKAGDYLRELGDREADPEECPYVDYYHFSREKENQSYYPLEGTDWYYEGVFWSGMPDLNLKSSAVRAEFEKIVKFWLDKGAAGFRLDAAKEYESGNNTANVEILSWLNETVKSYRPDAYLVAEVWTDIGTYEQYYASGIDSVFNFAFSQQDGVIAEALNHANGGGALSYGKASAGLAERFSAYNPGFIDAPFYTNHDVARSAGYYAGEGSGEKTKLAEAMNLLMSGSAFLYYGEELGMKGSGKDENKRAPMYWLEDEAGPGMCRGPEGMDSISRKFPSLEKQAADGNSVYQFVREAIRLRNAYPEIARGNTVCLEEKSDESVCVLKKEFKGQELLLVWNLGAEQASLNLVDVKLGGKGAGEAGLGGVLLTGAEKPVWESGRLTLPAYSMAVVRQKGAQAGEMAEGDIIVK